MPEHFDAEGPRRARVEHKDYERMIPAIEAKALAKVGLLEKYELALRGDCLAPEVAARPEDFFEGKAFNAVRNRPYVLQTEEQKHSALLLLLGEIVKRANTAQAHRISKEKKGFRGIPGILYGFSSRSQADQPMASDDWRRYFYGDADDLGVQFSHAHFLPLEDVRHLFPSVTDPTDQGEAYRASAADLARQERFPREETENGYYPFVPVLQLIRPDTYFNALVCADAILSDVERFDRESAAPTS